MKAYVIGQKIANLFYKFGYSTISLCISAGGPQTCLMGLNKFWGSIPANEKFILGVSNISIMNLYNKKIDIYL